MKETNVIVVDKILLDDLLDILLKSNYAVFVNSNEENKEKINVEIFKKIMKEGKKYEL